MGDWLIAVAVLAFLGFGVWVISDTSYTDGVQEVQAEVLKGGVYSVETVRNCRVLFKGSQILSESCAVK